MKLSMADWIQSCKHYVLMVLFLSGPDRLPKSASMIPVTLAMYFIIGATLVDANRSFSTVVVLILLEVLMLGAILYAGLSYQKKLPRFIQAYSALIGANVVISTVSIPIYRIIFADVETTGSISRFAASLELLMIIWSLAVLTLIFKRTFNNSILLSSLLVFNYFVVYQMLVYEIL